MAMTAAEKRAARAARKAEQGPRTEAQVEETERINEAAMQNPLAVAAASGEPAAPKRSGATVTVACKLGVTSYSIQLSKLVDKFEQNLQGGRWVKEAERYGSVVTLRGTAYPRGTPPKGFPPPPMIVGGAALNFGVDKDFWEAWKEQHKLDPLVTNGFIFAHESQDHVIGRAKEEAEKRSGLDPIDPGDMKNDPRVPRSTRSEIEDVAAGSRN